MRNQYTAPDLFSLGVQELISNMAGLASPALYTSNTEAAYAITHAYVEDNKFRAAMNRLAIIPDKAEQLRLARKTLQKNLQLVKDNRRMARNIRTSYVKDEPANLRTQIERTKNQMFSHLPQIHGVTPAVQETVLQDLYEHDKIFHQAIVKVAMIKPEQSDFVYYQASANMEAGYYADRVAKADVPLAKLAEKYEDRICAKLMEAQVEMNYTNDRWNQFQQQFTPLYSEYQRLDHQPVSLSPEEAQSQMRLKQRVLQQIKNVVETNTQDIPYSEGSYHLFLNKTAFARMFQEQLTPEQRQSVQEAMGLGIQARHQELTDLDNVR